MNSVSYLIAGQLLPYGQLVTFAGSVIPCAILGFTILNYLNKNHLDDLPQDFTLHAEASA